MKPKVFQGEIIRVNVGGEVKEVLVPRFENVVFSVGGREVIYPPGYKFVPSDSEMLKYFLLPRIFGQPIHIDDTFVELADLYTYDPDQLSIPEDRPGYRPGEGYFFSERKEGCEEESFPERITTNNGYWEMEEEEEEEEVFVKNDASVFGFKKVMKFYKGKPPSGIETPWILQEYRLNPQAVPPHHQHLKPKVATCVACRIYREDLLRENSMLDD